MIHYTCIQGSQEWLALRMGKPTASEFSRIITAKKWELAAGRHSYAMQLVTELLLDMPLAQVTTSAMQHGHDWESKAVAAYELQQGIDTEVCGFCTTDDETVGASPDRFVGEDGSLEVKCPEKPEIHVGYLFSPASLVDEYFVQTQGQLYVTDRKWTDLISYFGGLPMVRERITPHEEFQKRLHSALGVFVGELRAKIDLARERGWMPAPKETKAASGADFLTEQDVEDILQSRR